MTVFEFNFIKKFIFEHLKQIKYLVLYQFLYAINRKKRKFCTLI
jgi:hypothetical protein